MLYHLRSHWCRFGCHLRTDVSAYCDAPPRDTPLLRREHTTVGPGLIHHTATDKCVRGHRHTPVGMYDQRRMSGSIPVEHYSNQNKSEASVAIDDDLRNQKRQTCQGAPAVSLDAGLPPSEYQTRRVTSPSQLNNACGMLTGRMEAGHSNYGNYEV